MTAPALHRLFSDAARVDPRWSTVLEHFTERELETQISLARLAVVFDVLDRHGVPMELRRDLAIDLWALGDQAVFDQALPAIVDRARKRTARV